MDTFDISQLRSERKRSERLYLEFLRVQSLSMGVYELPAGATDPQKPHTEDEVYYVVRGRAIAQVGTEASPVQAGSIIFVAANIEHRFHTITEDLSLLVFFAPAEESLV
ncbi:MAG TPA: cupin domain-containing protein [Pyrinomonadaceae bacterium]|nr:cupin domain-containing protein [Pyrinomonadaceae bacterium]